MLRDRAKGTSSFPQINPISVTLTHMASSTNTPQINYDKFHKLAGLSSVASARELMRVTKNKLKSEYGALGADLQAANAGLKTPSKSASGTPTKGTPGKGATPGGRKRGAGKKARAEAEDDSEGDAVAGESPTKKVKRECAAAEKGGEVDGEGSD